MRAIADEIKQGTMETLLTAPVRDVELVVGKWLGAMLFTLSILAVTLVYPLILNQIVSPAIDQGLMIAQYVGIILLLSSFIAIGIFISSLFQNQIVAFFFSIAILLMLWMIGFPSELTSASNLGTQILKYLDMNGHFSSFAIGIVHLKDVIYFLSITIFSLFLGTSSVESRRWR